MSRRPLISYRAGLLAILLVLFGISAIRPNYPEDFVWEHILTAAALAFVLWLEFARQPLSDLSCTLLFLYLLLHILGAHYTYSEVPYDQWSLQALGATLSELLGMDGQRNHFDRLIHFLFGVMLMQPIREIVQRWMNVRLGHAIVIAAALMVALGTLYELFEWLYAEFAGQEAAEHYNGQQGDVFDPQKDITLNVIGTMIGGAFSAMVGRSDSSPRKSLKPNHPH